MRDNELWDVFADVWCAIRSTRTRASRSLAFHLSPSRRMLLPVAFNGQLTLGAVKRSTIAGCWCSPTTRAPTRAVSSATRRPAGFAQGKLADRRALTGDGVLRDLANLDRGEVRRTVRVGMRHPVNSDCLSSAVERPGSVSGLGRHSGLVPS